MLALIQIHDVIQTLGNIDSVSSRHCVIRKNKETAVQRAVEKDYILERGMKGVKEKGHKGVNCREWQRMN